MLDSIFADKKAVKWRDKMTTVNERMAKLETKVEGMGSDITEIKADLKEFIKCADKKYASKLTEKVVYGLVGMVLIAFITKLLQVW